MSPPPDIDEVWDEDEDSEELDPSESSEEAQAPGVLWPDPFDAGTDASTGDEAPRQPKLPMRPSAGIQRPNSALPQPSAYGPNRGLHRSFTSAPSAYCRGQKRKGGRGQDQHILSKKQKKSGDMDVEPVPDFQSLSSMEMNDYVRRWRKMHAINWQTLKKDMVSSSSRGV
eukprot:symbB.v1.2.025585.t1/scaffold2492.1/size77838/3